MPETSVSLDRARRLAVRAQLLDGGPDLSEGREGVAEAIEAIGYVQIDTISVVARAHHQTLRARRSDYVPEMLDRLLAEDRRVFEYWGHAASYLPMRDFRFYLPKMRRSPASSYGKAWLANHRDIVQQVHERVRKEGPLTSKDFQRPEGEKGGAWWDWKPAKMALEILFSQGELMISERRSFQRVYDLTERVLPKSVDVREPSDEEVCRFLVRRALDAYAMATEREIREHIHGAGLDEISATVGSLVEEGEVVPVSVEGREGTLLYARPDALDSDGSTPEAPRCTLLCPFDNLIIQRDRTGWLFGFDYTLECYLPPAKRVHGYFVFPILYGDRLVGRLDPKADRKTETFLVRSLTLDKGFDPSDASLAALAESLARLARFDGCQSVRFEAIRPAGRKRTLKRLVEAALSEASA
jgi:uncharacterized protein YcaQ